MGYATAIRVRVTTAGFAQPGFTTHDIGTQTIAAHSRKTLHLPTSIARSGRIPIEVQLLTPDAHPVGARQPLTVHSTVFGTVGVIITVGAGVVLLLALIVRGNQADPVPWPSAGATGPRAGQQRIPGLIAGWT